MSPHPHLFDSSPYRLIHTNLPHSLSTPYTYYRLLPTITKTLGIIIRLRLLPIYIMSYPYSSQNGYQGATYPYVSSNYQPQPQYTSGYKYTHEYQTLRPPQLNTGSSSNGYSMDRTSSHGSNDSGYFTRAPSVASPTLQQSYPMQSYPAQSYPIQSYPAQSYVPTGQLSQQSTDYSYGNQRSPNVEVVRAPPVSSSRHKKERRHSTPSPTSPSEYPCLHPNCGHISSRAHDLKRHMTTHFPPSVDELLDCEYKWCGRTGTHGFKREDHRKEHYRKVHMKENEYPKTGKGGRSGRSGGRP